MLTTTASMTFFLSRAYCFRLQARKAIKSKADKFTTEAFQELSAKGKSSSPQRCNGWVTHHQAAWQLYEFLISRPTPAPWRLWSWGISSGQVPSWGPPNKIKVKFNTSIKCSSTSFFWKSKTWTSGTATQPLSAPCEFLRDIPWD